MDIRKTAGQIILLLTLVPNITIQAQEAYAVLDIGTLTFYYDKNQETHTGEVHQVEAKYKGDGSYPSWRGSSISRVVFDESFANYKPVSTARWFHSCSGIEEISGLSNLNTSLVTSMGGMFYGCSSLKSLDVSTFNTSSVTDMYTMFYECIGLENLDLSAFDTGNVTTMTAMFYGCTGLKQLNVSSFNTGNVEDMQYMFFKCSQLTKLSLTNFDTHKVKNMDSMFSHGDALIYIDISSFDTKSVTNMTRLFTFCGDLRTIYVSEKWSTDCVTSSSDMFYHCSNLVGGNGTKCDGIGYPSPIDYTYARIDTEENPGYFTYKPSPNGFNSIYIDKKYNIGYYSIDGIQNMNARRGIIIYNGKKIITR